MRVMVNPQTEERILSADAPRRPSKQFRRLPRIRPWVQAAFLLVWLAPIRALQSIPGCTYHCYACPLASAACPVGLAANFAAAWPAIHYVPVLLIGVLVVVGALAGSLVCGWACPFGFLQDLLAKLPVRKYRLPNWLGYGRYVVLIGLVILLPYWLGSQGVFYEQQAISICRLCPAGALEAGLPATLQRAVSHESNGIWTMSWYKTVILVAFLVGSIVTFRPWCKIFCPLGGFLALFNRVSLLHLRFDRDNCIECNLCRTNCQMGVEVDKEVNTSNCIRCMECTTCGAIRPSIGGSAPSATPDQTGTKA
jgi:ferredoxin-type protein NapH